MAPPTPLPDDLQAVLQKLPDESGGDALVVATSGDPPAFAMLSTGDVWVEGGMARVAVHVASSVGRRLGGSFSLLVPGETTAYRLEVSPATARRGRWLMVVEGPVVALRPTAEPPWRLEMSFAHDGSGDPTPYVSFWQQVRRWLQDDAVGDGPSPPAVDGA